MDKTENSQNIQNYSDNQDIKKKELKKYSILLDTNFLIYSFKQGINITYELERVIPVNGEIIILKCVIDELNKLKKELKGKEKLAINLALKLVSRYKIVDYYEGKYADEMIVNYIKNHENCIVGTNDKILKKSIMDLGVPIILIKQQKYYELQGYL
ncbi:rRNA-processing protein FCF1 [Methanococcus voltae PS]|uniref:rRNA-processing protein FCF1 n=1 Tax=Methanococcus voltae PS TaxID=523842 RepID=A0ABT2EWN0_METVO|nr:PIN domain-containing protein [Methanococcus voltae]MCS3922367.1 rRNA-processing protein FCF1 [Methanococcus voltae PS]